jgi:hypothetical protein
MKKILALGVFGLISSFNNISNAQDFSYDLKNSEGKKEYHQLDTNKDGKITPHEMMKKHYEVISMQHFGDLDKNKDARLDQIEFLTPYSKTFEKVDRNENEFVTFAEFKHFYQGKDDNNNNKKFKALDKNFDQVLSKVEFLSPYSNNFHNIDQDSNGVIEIWESNLYKAHLKKQYIKKEPK